MWLKEKYSRSDFVYSPPSPHPIPSISFSGDKVDNPRPQRHLMLGYTNQTTVLTMVIVSGLMCDTPPPLFLPPNSSFDCKRERAIIGCLLDQNNILIKAIMKKELHFTEGHYIFICFHTYEKYNHIVFLKYVEPVIRKERRLQS